MRQYWHLGPVWWAVWRGKVWRVNRLLNPPVKCIYGTTVSWTGSVYKKIRHKRHNGKKERKPENTAESKRLVEQARKWSLVPWQDEAASEQWKVIWVSKYML